MTATLERLVFDNRIFILIALALVTVTGVYGAGFVRFDAALEKQLPVDHPCIETVLAFRDKIPGLNAVNIVVETREGSIWTKPFLRKLNDVTQDVSYVPGILRESVTSFWTPNTRVYEATEGAVDARNLIPSTVTPESLTDADVARIRDDALKGGFRGVLFAPDFRSAMITAAIQEVDPQTGKAVDVFEVATKLERQIRAKYENETTSIRMIGFAPFIGEVAREARDALWFFVVAFAITTGSFRAHPRDAHRTVDDRPYGGGPGMVLKPEPMAAAIDAAAARAPRGAPRVYLSAQGERLDQALVAELAAFDGLVLIAGRYEGLDERVIATRVDREVSLGEFVLSGGEVPALAVIDAVARLLPGVLGDERSSVEESFTDDLLDWPHYTRPVQFEGHEVPAVLQGGHHADIRRWLIFPPLLNNPNNLKSFQHILITHPAKHSYIFRYIRILTT